ncbi:PilZ domain-containing protein [Gayadomonas joobiniege]|uniref:PilZ domain-containing protein n=1 Tax=Gayadomonas joobiniege TaxID=1234606 RepID=UPI00037BED2E|nr:PilZ domain-containing protein [Gayadomonas joobiniege]
MIGQDDQRSYYRMMVNADCRLVVEHPVTPEEFTATCRDLSTTGMAVETEQPIDIGRTVSVNIASASEQIPPLQARGKVLRSTKESSDVYLIGIEIFDLK